MPSLPFYCTECDRRFDNYTDRGSMLPHWCPICNCVGTVVVYDEYITLKKLEMEQYKKNDLR